MLTKPVIGRGTQLVLQHSLADKIIAGTGTRHGWVSNEIFPRQAQRVLCHRHVELVKNNTDAQIFSRVEA